MATITYTVESRPYDHLYDPVYTTSASNDFYRAGPGATNVQRVPNGGNMFSDVPNYPRHELRLADNNELPTHVDQQFSPERAGQGPRNYGNLDMAVTGKHRYKYFKRPIVPFLQSAPPEVLMEPARPDGVGAAGIGAGAGAGAGAGVGAGGGVGGEVAEQQARDGKHTIAVQTDYRDGEAQTDPYTPDYVVKAGERPAVLALSNLTYARGLPAGLAEVEMIERMRQKRAFEESLPPITDEASFELRRKMMEEQELLEWAEREKEIDRIQAERLELLQTAIEARDRENEYVQDQRVEEIRRKKMEEKDRAVAQIQRRRITALRKLTKTRQADQLGKKKRDIITEYADYGSQVYAPVTRKGQHPDRQTRRNVEISSADLNTLGGLSHLESTLSRKVTETVVRQPKAKPARSTAARLELTIARDLERVDKTLRTGELKKPGEEKVELPAWRKRQVRVVRPPTPTVPEDEDEDDDVENAVLLIQKLLRGRAVQNMMFESKERRLELIRELRHDEELMRAEDEAKAEDARLKAAAELEAHQASTVDAIQGEVMSATLDFMAKELVRSRQIEKVNALATEAARHRRMREAAESGKRQAEEALRSRQDLVFRQLQRVHNQTGDSYFDDLIAQVVDHNAAHKAATEVYLKKAAILPGIDEAEAAANPPAAIVRDLVSSFLLPEVERQKVQQQVQLESRRHVEAARSAIEQVAKAVDAAQ